MTDEAPKFFGYLAIKKGEDAELPSFAFGRKETVEEAKQIWSGSLESDNDAPDTTAEGKSEPEPDFTHESTLTHALSKSVDFGLDQYQLIQTSAVFPHLFKTIIATSTVLAPTKKVATSIEDSEIAEVFGLNEQQYLDLVKHTERYSQMKEGLANVPSAIFISLVASFDTLIVEILGKMLRLKKEWLSKSQRTLPLSALSSVETLEDLIEDAVSDEIYQFSRGSHEEQARYIETQFGVGIRKDWKRWSDYIEIFERRNLVAHGEQQFNKRYASICTNAGHKGSHKILGEKVELRTAYLGQSLDILIEFAVLLSFQLWRKGDDADEDQAFTNLSEAVFKLTQNSRFKAAERIADFAINLKGTAASDNVRRMLIVNRASAIRHDGRAEEAVALLDTVDWSASSNVFRMCVSAVRADTAEFIRLLPRVVGSEEVKARSFVDWPCFEFVRGNEQVVSPY